MRWKVLVAALMLVVAACGGDDDAADDEIIPTSTAAETTTSATETTSPQVTTTTAAATTTAATATTTAGGEDTTTSSAASGESDCQSIWSLELIQAELGEGWGFVEASADGTTCTFAAIPSVVAMSFRTGGQTEFDASQSGAALTGTLTELDLCDAGFSVDVQGAIFIVEALDLDSGRIFTATVSGVDDPLDAATTLVDAAC